MKIKAFLKRDKDYQLYTNKELKAEAKRVSGSSWQDIYQYCMENEYDGIVRNNGKVSLTIMGHYRGALK